MKNIFKLMGLALIAGSLAFVSCSKDEDEDNHAINVNFDGNKWGCEEVIEVELTPNGLTANIYKNADADVASIQFGSGITAGNYSLQNSAYFVQYLDEGVLYNQYKNDGAINITDLNMDTKICSGNINAQVSSDGNEYKDLTVTVKDATFELLK